MFHVRAGKEGASELVMTAGNALAGQLADRLGFAAEFSDVALAGGNQLVGPDFRLVGHSSLQDDGGVGRSAANDRHKRWQRVQALDGRTVHSFGYRPEDLANASASSDLSETRASAQAMAGGKMHQCGFHVDQFAVSYTHLTLPTTPYV